MKQVALINIMKLILLELIFFALTEGFNISSRSFSQHSVRHKREETSEILIIKYHHENTVELVTLKKVINTTLASSRTPVWDFEDDGEESMAYNLEHVQPIFYHGVNSFAAITYFPHTRTLHGVIDYRYYIENLPINNANDPNLVDAFIHKVQDRIEPLNRRMKRMLNDNDDQIKEPPLKKFKKYHHKYESRKILYPEILLTVDVSSRIARNSNPGRRHDRTLMYVLSYWNAVDKLFRNLKRVDVRINIAGIFIGRTVDVIQTVADHINHEIDENAPAHMPDRKALDNLGNYFHNHDEIQRESFDFLIWMTRAVLTDEDGAQGRRNYLGLSTPPADCGGLHYEETQITGQVTNRAIIHHDDKYADYQIAARELAHLMFVYDDDVEVSHNCSISNCLSSDPKKSSGIMDPKNKRIDECLMWSYCSEKHIEKYANSKSSCCLLNYPYRSMGKPDPLKLLPIEEQCNCYGLKAASPWIYQRDICDEPLRCVNEYNHGTEVGSHLDGTPCVKAYNGFCLYNQCVNNY